MTKDKQKKITAIVPCYNEAEGIGEVVKRFPSADLKAHGYVLEILVINNNSTDRTGDVARAAGATVINESQKGKGNALRTGFSQISEDTDFVIMLDGDLTYRPEEILRLIELLDSHFCTAVVGSRLGGKITKGSMTTLNRAGNWIFAFMVRMLYRVNVTDVLTGYFAWTRDALMRLYPHLNSNGFAIEMEMVTKMARMGEEIYAVPISYDARAGQTNLRPFYDGSRILLMLLRNMTWRPKSKEVSVGYFPGRPSIPRLPTDAI